MKQGAIPERPSYKNTQTGKENRQITLKSKLGSESIRTHRQRGIQVRVDLPIRQTTKLMVLRNWEP
jgi:hypothetical protein